jgi:arsenical pump membrane protein
VALCGIVLTAALLLLVSALDRPLGMPAALAGLTVALGVSLIARRSPLDLGRQVAWSVLPLVAGLFVLVDALDRTGVISMIAHLLAGASKAPHLAAAASGTMLAVGSNLVNNLPAGLIAAEAIARAHPPQLVTDALLIGVDLGPNLSITGSLATILWLQVIRREGEDVGFLSFLKVGALTMPPALAIALLCRLALG